MTHEERVNRAFRRMVLLHRLFALTAAANSDARADIGLDDEDEIVAEAVTEILDECALDLEPLRHAPGKIGNWEPGKNGGAR